MIRGGIFYGVKTPLVVIQGNLTAVRYRDQVLMPHVFPLVNAHNLTFQHDNARAHVARVCRDFLNQNNVQVLDWPPYSPDLNPIEPHPPPPPPHTHTHTARWFIDLSY